MKREDAKSLEAFATQETAARFTENQQIAREARAARQSLKEAREELTRVRARLDLIEHIESKKLAVPKWMMPRASSNAHHAIPSLMLTDWHWGEVTNPLEVDNLNKYNVDIAGQRMRRAYERSAEVCRSYIKGVTYDGFNLMLGGDMISGDIHEELNETNELTVAETIVSIIEPLEAGIHLLVREFGRVNVSCVVGNHPRNTKKPRAKRRVQDNFDWLIYKIVERDFRKNANVTVNVATAADILVPVYDTKYLLTHGDQFKGGSGISGVLSPLLLGSHRKTRRAARAGKPYDVMVFGHFHQSLWFPTKGLIGSGCGCGYNEYAYTNNMEPEEPQSALWLTTPEHGITISAPIFVADRKAEGW